MSFHRNSLPQSHTHILETESNQTEVLVYISTYLLNLLSEEATGCEI